VVALDRSLNPLVILVVEDEMLLRMRVVNMVEDAGYIPVEAVDADDALAILQSRSDIALVLTDIQMPGSMNGLELAHAVRERWPPIKIILASGQLKLSREDIPNDSRFFGKPLNSDEIIAEMRDMLGQD
jgi:CheY-like chemotaxis protein